MSLFSSPKKPAKPRSIVLGYFFLYLQSITSCFKEKEKPIDFLSQPEPFKKNLKSFQNLLLILSHTNKSQDTQYMENLSSVWNELTQEDVFLNSKSPDHLVKLKIQSLLNSIKTFPSSEEYSLGYYLSEHVGPYWAPFPFMSILKKLHEENQSTLEKSTLNTWISLTESILNDLTT